MRKGGVGFLLYKKSERFLVIIQLVSFVVEVLKNLEKMCVEIMNNSTNLEIELKTSKTTYSLRKLLKSFFKKHHKSSITKVGSFESVENDQNMEIAENVANNKIFEIEEEDEVLVPVHFARTEHGTFFWTTNNPIEADADLIQPMDCCTNNLLPTFPLQDRWAQA